MKIRPAIEHLQPRLVEWRRKIHQYPELGFCEVMTAEFIAQSLKEWGLEPITGIAQTGIMVTITGNRPGKTLAFRADMDALPIPENNQVSYKSQHQGISHACGHDGHVAILLGVAHYLSQHREFAGEIRLIFQPAEEGLGGAKAMIEAGVTEGIDGIIGLHLWNSLPLGTVGIRPDNLMAASERFECTILGRGGHPGMPHQTVDAVIIVTQIIQALQMIVSRNINPFDPCVITVGQVSGGTRYNVIASSAEFSGTVRYFHPYLKDFIPKRIEEVIKGICQLHGAEYELNWYRTSPAVINDPNLTQLVRSVAETLVEIPANIMDNCQTMAGEDFSYFQTEIPGCFFFLGCGNPQLELNYPHHHPRFNFEERALMYGVEILVNCAEQILK
ncbi:amidohydrolase [Gloeothece citriformis PCC 7424]|uniref:Amidohydrolase n=1 Tax=Gloeothece citriformis (strain PCC 7424) TaxID=65393 RepID=B7KER9_GLOC7|nr:M20 family metallopeptidase [Gloeothece citriformis]ACK69094.1 amidohydrolase [Gloeothece citriformis PCC 7424]